MSTITPQSTTQKVVVEDSDSGLELLSRSQQIIVEANEVKVVSKTQKIVVESTKIELAATVQKIVVDSSKGTKGDRGPQGIQGEPGLDAGQNLFVQGTPPVFSTPDSGIWVQTGLPPDGTGITFWVEDGLP